VFEFRSHVNELWDTRRRASISTSSVWLCVFALFALRFRSLNALEQELRRSRFLESWVGPRKPSADTQARALGKLDLAELRRFLHHLNQRAWRAKAVQSKGPRVVAMDGHELRASRARCCEGCLVREVKDGEKTVLEYYHRVVVAQWVGVTPPGILDFELVLPHEGEVVAARRLLERIVKDYGRLIDAVSCDAIYLEAPFCRKVLGAGKHFVIVMKQAARELYQDAAGLRALHTPTIVTDGSTTRTLWDLPGLSTFTTLGKPVRVVWSEERTEEHKQVGGKRVTEITESTWIWVTDIPPQQVAAATIARWGHARWDIENRCFNELSREWAMDHCFVHHPTAIVAILLTLAIAFLTTYLFHERNLKPPVRNGMTRLTLGHRLREDLALLGGISVWPPPEPSG
jgi:hypothetical protein